MSPKKLPSATDAEPEVWYEDGLRFSCTGSGNCCKGPDPGWVIVEEEEVERLAEHLCMSLDAFGRKHLRRVTPHGEPQLSLKELPGCDCEFWAQGVGCQVYEARPIQCRTWPFWPENINNRRAWEGQTKLCPGMNRGKLYTREEIDRIARGKRGTIRQRRPLAPGDLPKRS